MPVSFAQHVDLQCPECNAPFRAEVWLIVDADERADLAARCRDGSIFAVTCPNGHTGTLGAPLLYHDRAREQLILSVPPGMDEQYARAIHAQLMPRLQAHLLAPFPAYLNQTQVVPQELLPIALADDPQAAFAEHLQRALPPLLRTLQEFITARTWDESRRILEAHPELLSDDADALLAQLMDAAREQNDADAEKMFAEHRDLLQRARREGIDAAFAVKRAAVSRQPSAVGSQPSAVSHIPAELQPLLQEIAPLSRLSEMPRKIELCEQALRLVQRESNPPLWAELQVELANALQQNPRGNRAANLEEAIRHYELALQVRARGAFPEQWAGTQNNLAAAYAQRIRGNRAENLERAIAHYELASVYARGVPRTMGDDAEQPGGRLRPAHSRQSRRESGTRHRAL